MDRRPLYDKLLLEVQPFAHGGWGHLNINRLAFSSRNLRHALSSSQRPQLYETVITYMERTYPALTTLAEDGRPEVFQQHIADNLTRQADELARLAKTLTPDASIPPERLASLEIDIPKHADAVLTSLRTMRWRVFEGFVCDATEVIGQYLAEWQDRFTKEGIRTNVDLPPGNQKVVFPPDNLTFVLRKIFEYSLNSMDRGSSPLISVRGKPQVERWLIEVKTSGIYIPVEQWPGFFDSENQPKNIVQYGFTEILTTLKKYEGDICIKESIKGSGTTFLIRLLILDAHE